MTSLFSVEGLLHCLPLSLHSNENHMIQSLYNLGLALQTKERYDEYFASYDDPFSGFNGEAMVLVFPIDRGIVGNFELQTYKRDKRSRYLFRPPNGPRGAPLVATGPFYPVGDLSKEKKLAAHIENVGKIMSRLERSIPEDSSLYFPDENLRTAGLETIRQQLEAFEGVKDSRYIFTCKINGTWLGDIPELAALLDNEAYSKYYEKSSAQGKTCSLSHAQNVEVWGRVDTLGFTVNDKAFNRGGFNDKTSYRMFPVSQPAVRALEGAKRFAFTHLNANFYSLKYVIIPRLLEGNAEKLAKIIHTLTTKENTSSFDDLISPLLSTDRYLETITEKEELSQAGNLYDILFYHENQAQFAMDVYLQDVSPSRISQIKKVQTYITLCYGEAFGSFDPKEKVLKKFGINFRNIKDFFSEGTGQKIRFDPFFFRLLEGVFQGGQIAEEKVVSAFMAKIRSDFKNPGSSYHKPYPFRTRQAIGIWVFLNHLGLFGRQNNIDMEDETTLGLETDSFLAQHEQYFSNDLLKGAFLVGVLTNMLLYTQDKSISSRPFMQKLNNLSFDKDQLRALVPKLLDKIAQYQQRQEGKNSLHPVAVSKITTAFTPLLLSEHTASRDAISFAFVTGMVMQQKFALEGVERRKQEKAEQKSAAV